MMEEVLDGVSFKLQVVLVVWSDTELSNFHFTFCLDQIEGMVCIGSLTMCAVDLSCVDSVQNVC